MENFFGSLWSGFAKAYNGFESWTNSLFAISGRVLPIEEIAGHIDPRFVPQAPMSGEPIDIKTRLEISAHGFKHSKLITPASHPELFEHWSLLCKRAGFNKPLQLILCDSDIPNAFAISDSEMGLTTGLLQHLTYREVIAVLSHELGHANNYKKYENLHAATSGGMSLAGIILPWTGKATHGMGNWMEARNRGLAAFAASFVGQVAGNKITGYSSELEADLEGAIISHDPEALASALIKLEGEVGKVDVPAWRKVWSKIKSVHPSTEERVRWLNEIKQELDATPQQPVTIPQPALSGPTPRIAAGQAEVERVSTNLTEAAI